jgi:NCS1 family nucleobase:cation symporter-1
MPAGATSTDRRPDEVVRVTGEVREGTYGSKVAKVEPGGAEYIPAGERHGRPLDLFWTWMSPNLEFATVFVGVLAVQVFGLTFWQAVAGIIVGTVLGSLSHGVLSARGPRFGVPQMILSRISFGYLGNILPAGLNALIAGVGWFAVNSVSGALALSTLFGWSKTACLVIIVLLQLAVAFVGHNFLHAFERAAFPLLTAAFVVAGVVTLSKAHPSSVHGTGGIGGFLLTVGATFGYAAGWNPYASDYTRYLPARISTRATGLWAGLGVFVSCLALETIGAASATVGGPANDNPTAAFTGHLGSGVADITLLAIALGAVSANAINIYSGAMSFLALGIRLPLTLRRAIVAVVFGVAGFILALSGLNDAASKYENFLLVISYWIGPWLGVFFTDQLLRRRDRVDGFLFDRRHNPWAGFVAMLVGGAVSIWLFSAQTEYVGPVAKAHPGVGDITFGVGFVLAAALYAVFFRMQRGPRSEALVVPD